MKPTLRCSSLDRALSCPGSLTVTECVDARKGEEGTEGTALHFIAHQRMIAELGAVGDLGPEPVIPPSVRFSEWIAGFYFRAVQDMIPADWSLQCEVALAFEFDRFILSGHIDCLGISPDGTEAVFFDLKTGYDPVDIAEENEQMFGYAALLLRAYPSLRRIQAYIIQPRNDEDEGFQRVSPPMVLEGSAIQQALPVFEQRINASLDQPMLLQTGKQCKWCVGCSCPAIRAEIDLMKMTMTEEQLAAIERTPNDALLGDFAYTAHVLAKPIEDAKALLKERLESQGSIVAGCGKVITVKVQRGAYSILRPLELWRTLAETLSEEGRAACAKWSFTAVKENIAKEMGIPKTSKSGNSAEAVFDARIRCHVEQGERKIVQFN